MKDSLLQVVYNYWWAFECVEIDKQFPVQSDYETQAAYDLNFVRNQQATGIYECYCTKYLGLGNFWEIWTKPELAICGHYAADLFGG